MREFLNQKWVQITAWCCVIIGSLVLILTGTGAAEIAKVPALVFGIVEAIGLLIIFVKKMLPSKDKTDAK